MYFENIRPGHETSMSPPPPPPRIYVSMAERQVQVVPRSDSTFPRKVEEDDQEGSSPLSLAEREREDYYARSRNDHCSRVEPVRMTSQAPPREKGPLDRQGLRNEEVAPSSSEGRGGSSAAAAAPSRPDWSRYSVLVRESEKEKSTKSAWLRRKQGKSRKWLVVGWSGTILLVLGIALGVVLGVRNGKGDNGDGTPQILNLGIFNSKEVHSRSSSTVTELSTGSYRSGSSGTAAPATETMAPQVIDPSSLIIDVKEDSATGPSSASSTEYHTSSAVREAAVSLGSTGRSSPTTAERSQGIRSSAASPTLDPRSALAMATTSIEGRYRKKKRFLNHASFVALKADFVKEAFDRVKRYSLESSQES